MDYKEKFLLWCDKVKNKNLLHELQEMVSNEQLIRDRFFKDLEFGTAGQRGIIGVGTNCFNIYTVIKTTQGFCNFLKAKNAKSVVICFDSRDKSKLFAKTAATVFAENGIKVLIGHEIFPTPFVSYTIREMKASAGVMITASHNPAEYNGYKAYLFDGCQLSDVIACEVMDKIEKVDPFLIKPRTFSFYEESGLIEYIPKRIVNGYLTKVREQHQASLEGLKIVYTPLNGAGWKMVPAVLKAVGCKDLLIVKEQFRPDKNFTTCPYPNPEKRIALELGIKYLQENDADLLIATDPDADRLGAAYKQGTECKILTGNEIGMLLTDFVLRQKQKKGTLPKNPFIVKTIVTSPLANKIASEYGARIIDTLTGFKNVGEIMNRMEYSGEIDDFVIGFEESHGFLVGTHVRDKDGVVSAMLLAECAAHAKRKGKTLGDRLSELYKKYGYYYHKPYSIEFPGATGSEKKERLLKDFRKITIKEIAGKKVVEIIDLSQENRLSLPISDVVIINLEDSAQIIVRPSGTEPIVKFYMTSLSEDYEKFFADAERFLTRAFV